MRVISTRDIFGAAREFCGGSVENWDGGGGDYSLGDLAEGVDGISPEDSADGSIPRLPSEEPPEVVLVVPPKKRLTKGRRVGA